MPRIFDNISEKLLPALKQTIELANRSDFCVGYFNLRGWRNLHECVDRWSGGEENCCRLLVGMQRLADDELRSALSGTDDLEIDNQTAAKYRRNLAKQFREQLTIGAPTNPDEHALRRLAQQIRAKKVYVKLFLRHPLHAKLYLLFRPDPINPIVGYLGSSNLTMAGLSGQGELNVDVMDHDACSKLAGWFEDRWNDRFCVDISKELVDIIDESWAREEPIPPYHIYLKIAFHLSREARAGLEEFSIPRDFRDELFEYQVQAVKIAARHLQKRNGVLIGDVVGLGKTLMATALARIFEDDQHLETLIICPKNLVSMWEDYRLRYRLRGMVLSISEVLQRLPDLPRFRIVVMDESHNLRNREGKRYRIIQDYIRRNDSKCILLSATPYNKTYLDLSNQLRLFIDEERDLGIRPETLFRNEMPEREFVLRHQCGVRTLAAFEKSEHRDDWRELMRLFLVRRTRSFIKQNYTELDEASGRRYLTLADGTRAYFPERKPRTIKFTIDEKSTSDQYAQLFSKTIVRSVESLHLPRYGLGNYERSTPDSPPTQKESPILQDLSRAGKRLMGFCRTNLFKRLESSGAAFLQSVERHVLRNFVYLHAIENDLEMPLGTQTSEMLDTRMTDADADGHRGDLFADDERGNNDDKETDAPDLYSEADFRARAAEVYAEYASSYRRRFKWLRPTLFTEELAEHLKADSSVLIRILNEAGQWEPSKDAKLQALVELLTKQHPDEKVIIFSQFADTVRYLTGQLNARGITRIACVTGDSGNPSEMVWRFSPDSNKKRRTIRAEDELRILVATDVLSEGQNLQDCAIVVNFDLPWAIIRLIQRAGRVDRIGQKAEDILCYSFLPADGVERIIRLRQRVKQRLTENAEVVGTDETFFEGDSENKVADLYHEKAGILDDDDDTEVDLQSQAYEIWKKAIEEDPALEKLITNMPDVVYATRSHNESTRYPAGVLVYTHTAGDNDALAYVGKNGSIITESQLEILRLAECEPDTPALTRHEKHHELVQSAVKHIATEEKRIGGQLGNARGARFRTYERLKAYSTAMKNTLFDTPKLNKIIDDIYRLPLRPVAKDTLNRQLNLGIDDEGLVRLVMMLHEEGRLVIVQDEEEEQPQPQIICSMGLFREGSGGS